MLPVSVWYFSLSITIDNLPPTFETDLRKSSVTDELKDTVDYVLLNKIVVEEMAIRSKLLERVAHRIITRIFSEIPSVSRILLAVSKLNPPIGGDVEAVTIEIEECRS